MLPDLTPLTPEQTGILLAALALALAALGLIWAAIRTARRAQAEHAHAMAATADALIRAHNLTAQRRTGDPSADHIARLARLRAASRGATQPKRPAGTNPGPGLRPHPVEAARERDEHSAWIIPPFATHTPPAQAGGTHAADTTESIVVPIPAGAGGEFAGAGAGGSWDSYTDTPATSPATPD